MRRCALLCLMPSLFCLAAPVLLIQQTQSPEHMRVAGAAQRRLLTWEATAAAVVDVNDGFEVAAVQSVPTLALLDAIAFDNVSETWSLAYSTMKMDTEENGGTQLNRYHRILYLTRAGAAVGASDSANKCLQPGTSYAACLTHLRAEYTVLEGTEDAGTDARDRLAFAGGAGGPQVTLAGAPHSAEQTLTLRLPHSFVRQALARRRNSTRTDSAAFPATGSVPALDFGVGIVFVPMPTAEGQAPPNSLLIFDAFTVLENSFEQLVLLQTTSYSIATHLAFWAASAQQDARIRVVTVEYLLDVGHLLVDVEAAANDGAGAMVPISAADCAAMQALLDALPDAKCLAAHPLCTPVRFVEGAGAGVQTWATVIFPIPPWQSGDMRFNTLLRTNVTSARGSMPALSSLNFFTAHAPRVSCAPAEAVAYDVTRHVRAELYRGAALAAEVVQGTFSVFNESALSSAEALVTLVLRPDDTPEALAYFATYGDERVRLDALYMSHGKLSHIFPSSIQNAVTGAGDGRSSLALDPALAGVCPLQGAAEVGACVTTRDWDLAGARARGSSAVHYVRQVSMRPEDEAADLAWLGANVFGPADPAVLREFRDATLARPFATPAAAARRAHAAVFWVWPVFSWPNAAPVGLADRTVVSVAWSVAP